MTSYLYVIRSLQDDEFCKIGKSQDPRQRLLQLQTGNQDILFIDSYTPETECLNEKLIHREFISSRTQGEWFRITDDVYWFITAMRVWHYMGCDTMKQVLSEYLRYLSQGITPRQAIERSYDTHYSTSAETPIDEVEIISKELLVDKKLYEIRSNELVWRKNG